FHGLQSSVCKQPDDVEVNMKIETPLHAEHQLDQLAGQCAHWRQTRPPPHRPISQREVSKKMTWLPALRHTVGSCRTHNHKEASHVLPSRFRPVADDDHAPSVAFEQAPGYGVGAVELRHGAGPLVCPDCGESVGG